MSQAERVVLLRQGARLPELDGIRGLAILPVLFLHWIVQPIEPLLRDLSPHLWALAKLAWCGVDLFFVLSGFLIAGILLDHSEAPNLFRAFYARRAARILPAYLLLLLIVSLPLGQQPPHIRSGEVPLSAYLIFLQNLWTSAGARVALALTPCWSLAIEEQFYLCLPLLLVRVLRARFASFAVVMLVAPPLIRCLCLASGQWSAWDFTPARLDAPFWGVLAAVAVRDARVGAFLQRRRTGLCWVALGGLGVVAASSQLVLLPAGQNLLLSFGITVMDAVFALALVAALLSPQWWGASVARSRALGWAGRRSYFLYLFHQLVLYFVAIESFPLRLAVSAVILFLLAAISWRWFESPILRLGGAVPYRVSGREPTTASLAS